MQHKPPLGKAWARLFSLLVSVSSSLCVFPCVYMRVMFIYAVSIWRGDIFHFNYRGRLKFCYQGSFLSHASSQCVSALSHHPVSLIYGLTQMSLVERNHVFIWCHWSFLSLTCHQLASLGNIFDVRVVHVLRTPHPATKAVSVSSAPVCSDRPATMMTASRRCGWAACEPTLTRRQKEQPAVCVSLLLPHQTSEPISSRTASHHQPGCVSLLASHAEIIIIWIACCCLVFTPIFSHDIISWIICWWSKPITIQDVMVVQNQYYLLCDLGN